MAEMTEEKKAKQIEKLSKLATWQGGKVQTFWLPILKAIEKIRGADYKTPLTGLPVEPEDRAEAEKAYQGMVAWFKGGNEKDTPLDDLYTKINGQGFRIKQMAEAAQVPEFWMRDLIEALWTQWTEKGQSPTEASPGLLAQYGLHKGKKGGAKHYSSKPSKSEIEQYEVDNYTWITVAVVAGSLLVLGLAYYFLIYRPKHRALPAP